MKQIAVLLLLGLATACASLEAKTPAQRVFAAQADYNALLAAALAYESQPRCVAPQKLGCSDTSVVAEIRKADNDTHAVLKAAQDTVRTPGATSNTINLALTAATNAVSAFQQILRNRGVVQ